MSADLNNQQSPPDAPRAATGAFTGITELPPYLNKAKAGVVAFLAAAVFSCFAATARAQEKVTIAELD